MRQKLSSISHYFRLPVICALCSQFHKNTMAVCQDCLALFKPIDQACRRCAYPLFDATSLLCGQCIKTPPAIDEAMTTYLFEEPLRRIIHQFKYHQGLYLASFLCQLMVMAWEKHPIPIQCLMPIPMHPKKFRQRGFNQAAVLTRLIARRLQVPYCLTSGIKTINTPAQASLDGVKRRKNLENAFAFRAIPYPHVTLIDDLLTTGSTANAVAHVLKKQGVKKVDIWCCARATSIH